MKKFSIFATSLVAIIGTLGLFAMPAMAGTAASGITIGPPVAEYSINKGETFEGVIKVNDYLPSTVTLYPEVADFEAKNETGQPEFVENDPSYKFSLSKWITISSKPIVLTTGELINIPYTITVPANAEPGGHYGVIFFGTNNPLTVSEGQAQVMANMKVGQLILVTTPGAIQEKGTIATFKTGHFFNWFPGIDIAKKFKVSLNTTINFITRIQNVGNVHFKPLGKITVKSTFGNSVKTMTVNGAKGNILPDSIRRFDNSETLNWYNFGYYKATLNLTYGTNGTLDKTIGFLIIPWWLIVIIILVVLWIYWKIRQHRRRAGIPVPPAPPQPTSKS
jgi:hypothetical protein